MDDSVLKVKNKTGAVWLKCRKRSREEMAFLRVNYRGYLDSGPVRGVDSEIEADIAEELREIGVQERSPHEVSGVWLDRELVAVFPPRVVEVAEVRAVVQWPRVVSRRRVPRVRHPVEGAVCNVLLTTAEDIKKT